MLFTCLVALASMNRTYPQPARSQGSTIFSFLLPRKVSSATTKGLRQSCTEYLIWRALSFRGGWKGTDGDNECSEIVYGSEERENEKVGDCDMDEVCDADEQYEDDAGDQMAGEYVEPPAESNRRRRDDEEDYNIDVEEDWRKREAPRDRAESTPGSRRRVPESERDREYISRSQPSYRRNVRTRSTGGGRGNRWMQRGPRRGYNNYPGFRVRRGKYMYRRRVGPGPPRDIGGPVKRRMTGEIDPSITKEVLKDRKTHIDARAVEVEAEMMALKARILNKTEEILKMKAAKLRLLQDPVALRLADLKAAEKAAVDSKDYLTAHNLQREIRDLSTERTQGTPETPSSSGPIARVSKVAPIEAEMVT